MKRVYKLGLLETYKDGFLETLIFQVTIEDLYEFFEESPVSAFLLYKNTYLVILVKCCLYERRIRYGMQARNVCPGVAMKV